MVRKVTTVELIHPIKATTKFIKTFSKHTSLNVQKQDLNVDWKERLVLVNGTTVVPFENIASIEVENEV